jgi:catalase (peroxidase I)
MTKANTKYSSCVPIKIEKDNGQFTRDFAKAYFRLVDGKMVIKAIKPKFCEGPLFCWA